MGFVKALSEMVAEDLAIDKKVDPQIDSFAHAGTWGLSPADHEVAEIDWYHPVIHGPVTPPDAAEKKRQRLLEDTSEQRKRYPIARGLLDYFPDACAAVAEVSYHGNEKHNPGQDIHWARGKSMDHADCIARHLVERGGFDGPIRHSAALAWRALALLQEELEAEHGLATPRGAKDAE